MLCADRRINPRDVMVISGYPGTENLVKQIKEAGLEKAQYLTLRHPKLFRNQLDVDNKGSRKLISHFPLIRDDIRWRGYVLN